MFENIDPPCAVVLAASISGEVVGEGQLEHAHRVAGARRPRFLDHFGAGTETRPYRAVEANDK